MHLVPEALLRTGALPLRRTVALQGLVQLAVFAHSPERQPAERHSRLANTSANANASHFSTSSALQAILPPRADVLEQLENRHLRAGTSPSWNKLA